MNRIYPVECISTECPVISDQAIISERYQELLGDESKLRADHIQSIYFPRSIPEVSWALKDIRARKGTCVISAGRTGIVGGAAPIGATSIISLGHLKSVLGVGRDGDEYFIRVQPGLSLALLTGMLRKREFAAFVDSSEKDWAEVPELWFPVNPTETSAHIGGIVATNASGARSFRYGATREWVRGVSVLLADGRLLNIRRGEVTADNEVFILQEQDGKATTIPVADVPLPGTKATLGYPLKGEMDLIDLFIGSEGTLGVLVEVELRLALRPDSMIGVLVTVPDEDTALQLVEVARSDESIAFDAIEYFDHSALSLLKQKKMADGAGSHIPDLPNWDGCGVYLEFSGSEAEIEKACLSLESILAQAGLSIDDTWAAMEPSELAAQRVFRHAVPEAVNTIIGQRKAQHPGLHKVGTDMAVPDQQLRNLFALYRAELRGNCIESVVFGHIGDNHVHVNLMPKNLTELEQAKAMYQGWAAKVVAMGGAVAAEHGIGRMKKGMLALQYSPEVLKRMQVVRRAFDPHRLLAPGVLFDDLSA